MQVRVLFFGVLKDLAGHGSDMLTLPDAATAGDVLKHYEAQWASLSGKLSSIAVSVNQEYVGLAQRLRSGDEVGLLPPVSGGGPDTPFVRLVRDRIVPHDTYPGWNGPRMAPS
jgi:molybdopterin converting factor small subunit